MIRSRWPVFFNALFLLWCAWWYCRDAGTGLLVVAGGLAALAWALYAVAKRRYDSWFDDGPVFLTLSAMSAIFAMIGLLFLIKEI